VVDILDDPKWGGGMRHVTQILNAYLDSEHYDGDRILDYIIRIGNSSPAKRLGFILEMRHEEKKDLLEKLSPLITKGYVLLDPTIPSKGPYISNWNIRANLNISQ
jgi:predicted transcriptional regulator of viral defense system